MQRLVRSLRDGTHDTKLRAIEEFSKCANGDANLYKLFFKHHGIVRKPSTFTRYLSPSYQYPHTY